MPGAGRQACTAEVKREVSNWVACLVVRYRNRRHGRALFSKECRTIFTPDCSRRDVSDLAGLKDAEPANWDGNISLSGGQIRRIEGWRFADGDATDGHASWKASTRYSPPGPAAARGRPGAPPESQRV
jgi:hypothetical protein